MVSGERMRELREKGGLSIEDVAGWLGMSKAQMLRYEKEKSDMTTETLLKIADFFNVSTDYLLGRTEHTHIPGKQTVSVTIPLKQLLRILPPVTVAKFVNALHADVKLDWRGVKKSEDLLEDGAVTDEQDEPPDADQGDD